MNGQHQMGPNIIMTTVPRCNFTWCFCCKYGYEAKCVHMAAFIFDAIVFAYPILNALINIGDSSYGWGGYLFLVLGLAFLGVSALSIMHIVKISEYMNNNELPERTAVYLSRRSMAIWAYLGFGVVIAVILIIILTNAAGALGFFAAAIGAIMILIVFGVNTAVLFGYRASFSESAEALSGRPIGSAPQAGVGPANVSLISVAEPAKPVQMMAGPPVIVSGPEAVGPTPTKKPEAASGAQGSKTIGKKTANPTPGEPQQAAAPKKAGITRAKRG